MYLNNYSNRNPKLVTILKAIVAEHSKQKEYLTEQELVGILRKYGYDECGNGGCRGNCCDESSRNSCILGINQEFLYENGFNSGIFEGTYINDDPPESLPTCLYFYHEHAAEMELNVNRRQDELDFEKDYESGCYSNYRNDKSSNNENEDDDDNEGGDYDLYGGGPTGDLTDDLIDSAFDGDPSNYWNID
jgi:hypothetical protein